MTFSWPDSLAASASSMTARMACEVSGAGIGPLGAGELDGGLEDLALRIGDAPACGRSSRGCR